MGSQILQLQGVVATQSRPRAVDLHYVFGYIDKLVDQTLSIHLGQDATLVVVPERPSHGLVVHVGLVLVQAPEAGDSLGVDQLEDTLLTVGPLDVAGAVITILQQLQQEFPQVRGRSLAALALLLQRRRGRRGGGSQATQGAPCIVQHCFWFPSFLFGGWLEREVLNKVSHVLARCVGGDN